MYHLNEYLHFKHDHSFCDLHCLDLMPTMVKFLLSIPINNNNEMLTG